MPPLLRYFINRLLSMLVTLIVITAVLYGFVMLTPPEVRAELYVPKGNMHLTPEQYQRLIERIIKDHHLQDPYPVQYARWASELLRGDWGWSPILGEPVLAALVRRTPVTAELTLYSLLVFIPLGLVSGVIAGWKQNRGPDNTFRASAFTATSVPTFILALILLSIFYVSLHWFPPDRLGIRASQEVRSVDFHTYTGFMTIDGLLNRRPDISKDALQHLILPVVTLSLLHWATLGRVTRATMIEEFQKEYVIAGKARGIPIRQLVWTHAFRNAIGPSLTSSALSAASLFTGVFVVEVIYNFKGLSALLVYSTREIPDAPTVLGFGIYSVIVVMLLMLILDLIQAITDPRVGEGIQSR